MDTLTLDQFKQALPAHVKKNVNQEIIDNVNSLISEPEMREAYRDNLISYTHVLKNGKFKLSNYLDAVRYVSYKLMGSTNIDSYSKAFPEKITKFQNQGVASKDIASYVTAYNKNKLGFIKWKLPRLFKIVVNTYNCFGLISGGNKLKYQSTSKRTEDCSNYP